MRALVGNATTLAAVTDEQDQNLLWNEFLEMMRLSKPELTLAELKQAVEEERTASPVPSATLAQSTSPTMEPPEKRPRLSPVPSTLHQQQQDARGDCRFRFNRSDWFVGNYSVWITA